MHKHGKFSCFFTSKWQKSHDNNLRSITMKNILCTTNILFKPVFQKYSNKFINICRLNQRSSKEEKSAVTSNAQVRISIYCFCHINLLVLYYHMRFLLLIACHILLLYLSRCKLNKTTKLGLIPLWNQEKGINKILIQDASSFWLQSNKVLVN